MMRGPLRCILPMLVAFALAACSALPYQGSGFRAGHVQVRKGETLYSIAWRYDLDYHQLARWNGLTPPYTLTPGQWIRMNPPGPGQTPTRMADHRPSRPVAPTATAGVARPYHASPPPQARPLDRSPGSDNGSTARVQWVWPTRGRLLQPYSKTDQGVEIAGKLGQPVVAAASGQVVYSGNGLPSYGNLVIIKHNGRYLSAYGHNQKLLVREGDVVKRGQTIALMGESGTGVTRPMLFFEIRVDGDPVNPIPYLPARAN
ncbi:Lipoprotein NlpD [Acidihalobacter prosperus]|uniref:Lipoprotein NlpD n=1 Tax=Acidihalobacter prosperus TaxID=160660 RepID=A0A1A6C823_9GAMM|nr:Lipoprotein NlpD [Acidihalobacter prosperus]